MDKIPLPIAIALIATSTGCLYFFVKSWLAAKERDARDLDSRFDDVYRHIDKVEEALDRRITDENTAMWRNIDDLNFKSRKTK